MPDNRLAARIDQLVKRFQREDVNLHGFILTVDGKEKAKAYYAPFREGQPHRMYSVSKTFTGIAVGMLADDGKISLDDPITDYFRDWLPETPDERLLRLTIRDMLRMATCYRWTAYREGVDFVRRGLALGRIYQLID
ncbi:MAG: beta-lactamase family protein [Clostridia bacterium]|nr:beta-lactamase family protein [Clostridia bacterium]